MKTIIQLLIYWVISHLLFAQKVNTQQPPSHKKYQHYLIAAANLDSLIKVASTQSPKINTAQYLNLQLSIELGIQNNNDSTNTQKVKQIIQLAIKQKSEPDLAMAYFILGRSYSHDKEDSLSFEYLVKAEKVFTKNSDTTGILNCYRLLRLSVFENYIDLSKSYFNKLIALSQKSSNPIDKYFYYISVLSADPYFEKQPTEYQLQEAFKKANELIDKYPYFESLRRNLYHNLMQGYANLNKFDKSLEVAQQVFRNPKIKANYMDYQNLGRGYIRVKKYDEAIVALEKASIDIKNLNFKDFRRQRNIYRLLKTSYYAVGNLKASIKADEEFDRLNELIFESDRSLAMFHLREKYSFEDKIAELKRLALEKEIAVGRNKLLQTQYESEKREVSLKSAILAQSALENRNKLLQSQIDLSKNKEVIKTFALENQIAQTQKRILILSLLAAVAVIVAIGALFFKLSQKNKELLILQKSREKLYTIIAHDLRSPISTFQRYSEIITYLIKTKQFTRLETTTHHVDQTSKNLTNLLNNLLGWSLNQQGLVKNIPESVQIKDFFDSIFPIYRDMANLNSLQLVTEIEDTSISIDPNKFALIVRNMLDNAIKFSEENNQVQIQARLFDNTFLLTIINKSKTSTTKQKKAIKELFESKKDYAIGENRNFGIGLIIVKEYAKIMDAKITFDYDINCLTTFSFELPQTTNI
ncbi:hypothetical protein GCM10027035_23220 [Emticicia sediminis]